MTMLYHCGDTCWHGGPLPDISPSGDSVWINGLELNIGGAFMCLNSYVLTDPAPKVRFNHPSATLNGEMGRRSRRTIREVDLEVRVVGYVDATGALEEDIIAQCEHNIDLLEDFTINAAESEYGAIPLVVGRKSGRVLLGNVQVNDFVASPGRGDRTVSISLGILGGQLNYLPDP